MGELVPLLSIRADGETVRYMVKYVRNHPSWIFTSAVACPVILFRIDVTSYKIKFGWNLDVTHARESASYYSKMGRTQHVRAARRKDFFWLSR